MSATRLNLRDAKAKLDVATLWRALSLPGEPGRSCRCPLHEDRSASFSVFVGQRGGLRWKCHAGCGQGGPVELLARVFDIPEREACRRLLEMAGGDTATAVPPRPRAKLVPPPQRQLVLPVAMRLGTQADLQAVADRRGLSLRGVAQASIRGLLWFATSRGCPSWIVTDGTRINAQARRVDGTVWEHIGGAKAWTLPGSKAAWPIGTREATKFPFVVLVEGGPDLLAAHHFIAREGRENDVAAVAMLGSSNHIPGNALKLLAGKRVRLFPHADRAGQDAAGRWTGQLERVRCAVDAFRFDGLRRADSQAVKDLNDLVYLHPECMEAERNELSEVLPR